MLVIPPIKRAASHRNMSNPHTTWQQKFNHTVEVCSKYTKNAIIGDIIISNFMKHGHRPVYILVYDAYLSNWANLGIGGDCVEHILWRCQNGGIPCTASKIIVQGGSNNVERSKHHRYRRHNYGNCRYC